MERDSGAQGKGLLEELMRERIQRTIKMLVEQELAGPWVRRARSELADDPPDIGTDIERGPPAFLRANSLIL